MEESEPEAAPEGPVELRGIITSMSSRFYTGGWGFGQLQTDSTVVKITGALEGHVVGTCVVVRGFYKTTQYGVQVECSTIMVDSVSGELPVIQAWAKKRCKNYEKEIMYAVRQVNMPERWPLLSDAQALQTKGLDEIEAIEIALAAQIYMIQIKAQRELMELGFTDTEAEKLFARYAENAMKLIEEDPYQATCDRIVPFARMDVVVSIRCTRNNPRRLQAAIVQALAGMLRDGSTAGDALAVQKLAADIAGVYVDQIVRTPLPKEVVEYGDHVQLKGIARHEADIARWIVAAAKLENES